MYRYLKNYQLLSAILFALGIYIPSAALAQSEAPIDPAFGCESAGGVWDSSAESLCAPCSLCISNTGEVRGDSDHNCPTVCEPWCRCPEGLIFDGSTRCLAPEELLSSCVDETPEEDDNSCDQNEGQVPLYLVFLALSVLLSRRILKLS
jgi:hypothetical protein